MKKTILLGGLGGVIGSMMLSIFHFYLIFWGFPLVVGFICGMIISILIYYIENWLDKELSVFSKLLVGLLVPAIPTIWWSNELIRRGDHIIPIAIAYVLFVGTMSVLFGFRRRDV